MGRLKQNVKISKHIRIFLQSFANVNANIHRINDMTDHPEISELIDSQNDDACAICEVLCKELNIVGNIDDQLLQQEEEYYENNGMLKANYVKRYSK